MLKIRRLGCIAVWLWMGLGSSLAHANLGLELEALLDSSAGKFLQSELAVSNRAAFTELVARHQLEEGLLRWRENYLRARPADAAIFGEAGNRVLSFEEQALLRSALTPELVQGVHIGSIGAEDYAATSARFLSEGQPLALPKGGVYPIQSARRDLFGGTIFRVSFDARSWNPRYLLKNPGFETGYIDHALQTMPKLFEPLGFKRVVAGERTWIEFPDAEALNARLKVSRSMGHDPFDAGARFEAQKTQVVKLVNYADLVSRKIIPVGEGGQFMKHDILVHGVVMAKLMPAEVFENVARRFEVLLKIYRLPRMVECTDCRAFLRSLLGRWEGEFDADSGNLLRSVSPEVRPEGVDAPTAILKDAQAIYRRLNKTAPEIMMDLGRYTDFNTAAGDPLRWREMALMRETIAAYEAEIRGFATAEGSTRDARTDALALKLAQRLALQFAPQP